MEEVWIPFAGRRRHAVRKGTRRWVALSSIAVTAIGLGLLVGRFLSDKKGKELRGEFSQVVVPIFERKCASCHGVSVGTFESQRNHYEEARLWRFPVDDEKGRIVKKDTLDQVYLVATEPYGGSESLSSPGQSPSETKPFPWQALS